MKYFLIAKKDNVIKIIPFKESYVYSSSDDGLFYEDTLLIKNIDGASIYKISDNLIQIFDTEKGYYYLNDRFNVVKSNFYIIPNKKYKFLIAQASPIRISMGVYKKSIYFLNENLTNEEGLIIDDNYNDLITYTEKILILGNKNELYGYNIQPFNPLWHFNIQNIPNQQPDWEVKKIIGVLENKLWVALNHHTIVALDIQTGALLHQLHDISHFQCAWLPSAIPEPEATQIDEKNNKLIGFMWEFYWEINPKNGEIQFWDLSEEFLSQKIRNDVSKFVLTDEKIYFASHFDSKIASFDRKTKKIEWFYHFEKENEKTPRIMEIQGNDQKIGALSSAGTLYIFEKEEISLRI